MSVVNAAPMVDDLGTQDLSANQVATVSSPVPQHLPKFYIWAEKGPEHEELLVGVERENIYGDATFTMGSPYANHATLFANNANSRANACMYKRLIPEDAGPKANLTLWLDVLPSVVDLYERNSDGSIKTTPLGDPIVIGTAEGYKVKWVVTSRNTEGQELGGYTQQVGNQRDPSTGATSTRYPIFDFVVYSRGAYGNRLGVRFWAPNSNTDAIPYAMMNEYKAFPYFFSIVDRATPTSSATVLETLFGEQNIMTVLKPDVIDPMTRQNLSIADRVVGSYGNLTDPRYPVELPPFGGFFAYQNNINELTELFHAAEVPFINEFSDFGASPEDAGLFNIITGQSTFGVPYNSFVFSSDSDSVTFSKFLDVEAGGGSDGTMNDEVFAELVSKEIKRYRDRKDELMDLAYHVESIFYDSGFPASTKLDLPSFISQRHDTFVVLGTHTQGQAALTQSQEYAMAMALRARVMNYPESAYFGTPATRAMIMGCSGVIRGTKYRVPATYEILSKLADYMGASNGAWKGVEKPDGNPGNVVEDLTDLNMYFVADSVRNRFWDAGLNWILRYDRGAYFIPAYRTVFPDDTSVLTSAITVMAVCQLNKIGHKAWRNYSGVSYLTDLQLCERVNNFVLDEVKDKFDNRFRIVPRATVTDLDQVRGFSWTLPIGIGAANMKTVQTLYVQADRIERLQSE